MNKYELTIRERIDAVKNLIRHPITYGCYEIMALTADGGWLCHNCCKENYKTILHSTRVIDRRYLDQWAVIVTGCSVEYDNQINCAHCDREIVEGFEDND